MKKCPKIYNFYKTINVVVKIASNVAVKELEILREIEENIRQEI